jgi:hypothetical protein
MDGTNLERLSRIFARSVRAFAAEPSVANFGRYRVVGFALDAARELAAAPAADEVAARPRPGRRSGAAA